MQEAPDSPDPHANEPVMRLRDGELALMQQVVRQLAGVTLEGGAEDLVERRLGPVAASAGCGNFNELYFQLRYSNSRELAQQVVDAITTRETSWFGDAAVFDAMQATVIPAAIEARRGPGQDRRLRLWCAAGSTGQEAYGLAMMLCELIPDIDSWDIEVLGSDIARSAVTAAEAGVYTADELARSGRPELTNTYCEPCEGGYRVVERVRRLCRFERRNLLEPIVGIGPFDVVLVRNVLPYFEEAVRHDLLARIRSVLLPTGWLFAGADEDLAAMGERWEPELCGGATAYRPKLRRPSAVTG